MVERASEPPPSLVRNALIPLSIATCFALVYGVEAPPVLVFPVGGAVMALYLAAPWIGRRSMSRFDRDAVQLLARGRAASLPPRFARAIGMRLFAVPALVHERRGLAEAEGGDTRRARDAYRAAFEQWPEGHAPLAVRLGLGHASYACGDDADAIRMYRSVLKDGSFPNVAANLAHALARRDQDLAQAEELIERAMRDASEASAELRLIRGLVHAKRRQRGPARKILNSVEPPPPDTRAARLRKELERAIEAIDD